MAGKGKKALLLLSALTAGSAVYGTFYKRKKDAQRAGRHVPRGPYEAVLKRLLDVLLAGGALILLAPVMAVTAGLVRFRLGAPVIFRQQRPGLNGEIFMLYKFRTMTDARDQEGNLLSDEERLTRFGKRLRESSLDELPELMNIIKGDMSLVGPRPLLVEYLPRYSATQARRHVVRPGITGLAQVNGRNAISWEEKFEWDIKYVDSISFLEDVKIILKTVTAVLRHEGISSETAATMEKFEG